MFREGDVNFRGNPLSLESLVYWSGRDEAYHVSLTNYTHELSMDLIWDANSLQKKYLDRVLLMKNEVSDLLQY